MGEATAALPATLPKSGAKAAPPTPNVAAAPATMATVPSTVPMTLSGFEISPSYRWK